MEKPNIAGIENPAVRVAEYDGNDKKEPSTPSVHSRDGSKEKEAGFLTGTAAYPDIEGQEDEIHLETAADLVTHIIDLDDDTTLNPWTFRMFFIGRTSLSNIIRPVYLNSHRHGPFLLRCCPRGDLLF
jgi:hypothetical protein